MRIKFLGAHHNETSTSKCTCILIDGKLAIDAGSLTYALSMEEQLKIKTLLLTHQHYDHVRDAPSLAVAFFRSRNTLNIYATKYTCDVVSGHLFDGSLYPKYTELPKGSPAVKFNALDIGVLKEIDENIVLPLEVKHVFPTVGYQITSMEGKTIFYTGDSGPGLDSVWQKVNPQLLIADVTYNNHQEERAVAAGHLTPNLLKQELLSFRKIREYFPRIILTHLSPEHEKEIAIEAQVISKELNVPIELAHEGMEITL